MAPHGYWPDERHAGLTMEFAERAKKLPLFIRSAIQRPDLAAKVKALQLVEFGATTAFTSRKIGDESNEMDVLAGCMGPIFEKTRRALPDESREDSASWKWVVNQWSDGTKRRDPVLLVQIALLLIPNLERLSVAHDFSGYEFLEISNCNGPLTSLKSIALLPWIGYFHIQEAKGLFAAAPNLETLYASNCGFKEPGYYPYRGVPFDLSLGNLQKLVIGDLEFVDLEALLPACPQLQELQYVRPEDEEDDYQDMDALEVLMPVQKTLRTLKIKFTHWEKDSAHLTTIESLKGFIALEELVIEQATIPDGARVVDWLPPSVERVHFRDVTKVSSLMDHLSLVASEAPTKLLKLQYVRISPWYLPDWNGTGLSCIASVDVTAAFNQAGITVEYVAPRIGEQEPWLDLVYPELVGKIQDYTYF
ncbi:hypothetical protein N657DRAFT_649130 [Parathielavia appendiculata]|uniref:Uncharacterized protein n=1 Tax=Parathielavia appendiculata TaxID=2587402 RepID=A0AAN6Z0D6_9PEZI|nr:hypothetical protein N657DRAFT_649130 [Parathielavia appendiculata]